MNRNPNILETSPTLNLHSELLSLRLPAGAAIFALMGTVWLTQEGLRDDIVLMPGDRFGVKSDALILASAVRGGAVVHVVQPSAARVHAHADVYDFARAHAHDLRRDEIRRLAGVARRAIAAWITRMRGEFAARPNALRHRGTSDAGAC
jgi:hypothetical protein